MEELKEMYSKILTNPEEYKFLEKIFKEEKKKKFRPTLLYRATRDTDNGLIFHKKCDNIKDTLTLVKTKTGNIFGGYISETWDGNNYKKDDDAFCFSIDLKKKYKSKKTDNAIYSTRSYGPCFGDAFFWVFNRCFEEGGVITEELNKNYDNQVKKCEINNGKDKFFVEDIEVFEIKFE